jgi:hypothetical protein
MDITALLQALPDSKDAHTYLLFEAGAQPIEDFQAFHSKHASAMYSLYIHPQLEKLQEYGPWLLEVENQTQLPSYLDSLLGIVGIVVAHRHISSVAIQLSRGCTVVGPDNSTSLVRFYAQHVISILALSSDSDWHAFLFRDIEQWWAPAQKKWEKIIIPTSTASNPTDHVIRPDNETWQQIADKPDVGSVLTQWQEMPSSQHFPACIQRDMVVKALRKAKDEGINEGLNNKLYALYYLDGGKKVLESEEMRVLLQKVSQGKISLAQLLTKSST